MKINNLTINILYILQIMSNDRSEVFKLYLYIYQSRCNILGMLKTRGFDTSDYSNYTTIEIKEMLIQQQNGKFETSHEVGPLDIYLKNDSGNSIFIKYRLEDKFKKTENLTSQINKIYDKTLKQNDTLIILYISRIISKIGVKDINNMKDIYVNNIYANSGYFVQLYGLENFLINFSNHQFVPKHSIINKDELQKIVKKYNIDDINNLPIIKLNDVQAKYIGLRLNQVCKITYSNITSGVNVKYKICKL